MTLYYTLRQIKKTPITKVNKCQKLADRENCRQRDHDGRSIIVCLTLCLLLMTTECTINARHRFMSFHLFCNLIFLKKTIKTVRSANFRNISSLRLCSHIRHLQTVVMGDTDVTNGIPLFKFSRIIRD